MRIRVSRISPAVVLSLAALMPAVAFANVAWEKGVYAGGNPNARVSSISFTAGEKALRNLSFSVAPGPTCSDGGRVTDDQRGYDFTRMEISDRRRFSGTGRFASGTATASFTIRGRLGARGGARGTLRSRVAFIGQHSRAGTQCDTGRLTWSASRP